MDNFLWDIGTKVYFGRGQIKNLGPEAATRGKKALLVYGGGSVKRTGVYDAACESLMEHGVSFAELSGVDPNPRIGSVREGVRICREFGAEMVIALGGGSSIDCAKVIAASVSSVADPWDLVCGREKYKSVLPILTVLTLAATGSEMDHIAVISNMAMGEKIGTRHPAMRPAVSILDPEYTFSVPPYHTACGTADIFAHAIENYLWHDNGAFLQDRFAEAVMQTCVKYGPIAVKNPEDYEARANLMWAGSHAINGLLSLGKEHPWTAHQIEHPLSAYYDVTHGAGLAIILPRWLNYILSERTVDRLRQLAVNVWGVVPSVDGFSDARAGIIKMQEFFASMNLPSTLREVGISDRSRIKEMAQKAARTVSSGTYVPLSAEDVENILEACW
ncbi:MAG: iron-containing alcohol dehydrogenase [Oscillospiraceae bacterium]|jgi:alcohol dehydrogenase YqhD (iron-dependent ADH family)